MQMSTLAIFRHSLVLCFLVLGGSLLGQMAPNAPVKNFKLPRFGDDGYTQWVLQGARGIYDSEEQVRVESMALRVYSGDERMALELSLDSPQATIRLQENRAFSGEPIVIEGEGFRISGTGWEWLGEAKEIRVEADSRVAFAQEIVGSPDSGGPAGGQTTIASTQLMLKTTQTAYTFEFSGGVEAASADWQLRSDRLLAIADAPQGESPSELASVGQLGSLRRIHAQDQVVLRQGARTVRAAEAEFFTRERRAVLRGRPSIKVAGAYLTGEQVDSREGEILVVGSAQSGRAQMILLETGGLGLGGAAALSSETIVLADRIRLRETPEQHEFYFEGRVEVLSGAVQLASETLTVLASRPEQAPPGSLEGEALPLGSVTEMLAQGKVRIERSGQVATSEQMVFYPEASRAVLTGQPRVTNGTVKISGQSMELQPQLATVQGTELEPVEVELPELPDLGFAEGASELAAGVPGASASQPVATVIRSRLLKMEETEAQTRFRFTEQVEVAGNNLAVSCERLDVTTVAAPGSEVTGKRQIDRIEAFEHLKIEQTGRIAEAARGTIYPAEGRLVLEEGAVVRDARGQVNGHRLTLLQGQRRAIVEGGGPEGERARITLPGLDAVTPR